MTDPWLFFLAAFGLLAAPGPTNALLASAGASRGFARAWTMPFAALLGYMITVCVIGFALRPVLVAYPQLGVALKLAMAAYLAVLAIQLWRRRDTGAANEGVTWRQQFTTTLLNPKGAILALAIVPFDSPWVGNYLAVFAALILIDAIVWLAAGHAFGALAASKRHMVPKITSIVLVGFAGLIAASALA